MSRSESSLSTTKKSLSRRPILLRPSQRSLLSLLLRPHLRRSRAAALPLPPATAHPRPPREPQPLLRPQGRSLSARKSRHHAVHVAIRLAECAPNRPARTPTNQRPEIGVAFCSGGARASPSPSLRPLTESVQAASSSSAACCSSSTAPCSQWATSVPRPPARSLSQPPDPLPRRPDPPYRHAKDARLLRPPAEAQGHRRLRRRHRADPAALAADRLRRRAVRHRGSLRRLPEHHRRVRARGAIRRSAGGRRAGQDRGRAECRAAGVDVAVSFGV